MKRFCNRLSPALLLALCLICAPSSLLANETSHNKIAAPVTEHVSAAVHESEAGVMKGATEIGAEHGVAQEEAAVHGEKGHGPAGVITKEKLNDLFWRILNFVLLVLLLVKFAAKPVADSLSERRQRVREEIEGLEAKRQDAEKAYQELVVKLEGIEKDIKEIVDRAVVQAEKERARIIEAAEKSATDLTRQAEMAVQKELLDAKRLLRNEVADRAATMAEEIIKNSLTQDDQVRIVDQYLSKVEAVQ
ncbi:MAG: F0F1 ATP synthase subunit B [Desulfobulbaceae bacterium]|jgi:F-type H+-transporting ATPase subunit b|nr:F0F1 ATP synthase subunit B [Desulfobulbaceae bacterium]